MDEVDLYLIYNNKFQLKAGCGHKDINNNLLPLFSKKAHQLLN